MPSLGLEYNGNWIDDSTFEIHAVDGTRNIGRDSAGRAWRPLPKISDASYTANYFAAEAVWVQVYLLLATFSVAHHFLLTTHYAPSTTHYLLPIHTDYLLVVTY